MDTTDAAALLPPLLKAAGIAQNPAREPIRVWERSGVERLRMAGDGSVVFKYALEPFDREHLALTLAARAGLPVPRLIAARTVPGLLGMLLEDLGQPVREAGERHAAEAAVQLHRVPLTDAEWRPRLNETELARLPARIAARARKLSLPPDVVGMAVAIAHRAGKLAQGTGLPPFGFCHSEFHPTSLHIGDQGWRLLDFARAFTGPGLLDLASWQGTTTEPEPAKLASLISAYTSAGGPPETNTTRGGLPAPDWALGWHRVWISDWYTEQVERGWAGNQLSTWTDAISKHLAEAAVLLRI
jgi:hypothetical protein